MIELIDVAHRYDQRVVLDAINLTLSEPRIAIIGANGSGKSTLARMLNGLVVPERGRVLVDGLNTASDGAAIRRRVGFVFADPDAQIIMPTVSDDVQFSLRRLRLPRAELAERVAQALHTIGLSDHADHPAHLLSSGQKQLLAFASVLVTQPSVLVCDEPTTLLDRRNTRRVAELIADLSQQVILSTHDLELVADWERVIVLDQARVVADGPAAESIAHYLRLVDGSC